MSTLVHLALRSPLTLAILAASTALTALLLAAPPLAPWSGRAPAVLLLGLVAGGVVTAVSARLGRESPLVHGARGVRDALAVLLEERRRCNRDGEWNVTISILAEALEQLDTELLPSLSRLAAQNERLRTDLARLRPGLLAAADVAALERLESVEARQREALAATIQQVASAYALALALVQPLADAEVADEARLWCQRLRDTQDALQELVACDQASRPRAR